MMSEATVVYRRDGRAVSLGLLLLTLILAVCSALLAAGLRSAADPGGSADVLLKGGLGTVATGFAALVALGLRDVLVIDRAQDKLVRVRGFYTWTARTETAGASVTEIWNVQLIGLHGESQRTQLRALIGRASRRLPSFGPARRSAAVSESIDNSRRFVENAGWLDASTGTRLLTRDLGF